MELLNKNLKPEKTNGIEWFNDKMRQKIKIAFLMMVHNNPEQINCFINQVLQYSESYVYIHVDKKGIQIIPSYTIGHKFYYIVTEKVVHCDIEDVCYID